MNQTYLQGVYSDMADPDDAVFFEATPENISAFLMRHQAAAETSIGTVDDWIFLTARTGIIDVCPDQDYLTQTLLPVYSKVQSGELPTPPLETVSRETALAGGCPKPDWNYLRWGGYSDERFQALTSGKGLLEMEWCGKTRAVELQVRSYQDGGRLALLLVDWSSGSREPWGALTVNLGCPMEKGCAFIDTNNMGFGVLPWIEAQGLGKPTGRSQRSGYSTYTEYRFDTEKLKQIDPEGYQVYAQRLEKLGKEQHQRKKGCQER